jgi:hypothetical protein
MWLEMSSSSFISWQDMIPREVSQLLTVLEQISGTVLHHFRMVSLVNSSSQKIASHSLISHNSRRSQVKPPNTKTYIHPTSSNTSTTIISLPGATLFSIPNFDLYPWYKYKNNQLLLTNGRTRWRGRPTLFKYERYLIIFRGSTTSILLLHEEYYSSDKVK